MAIFFSLALIYGLTYTYIFFKLSATLGFGLPSDILLGLFLFLMSLSPVLIHVYSLRGPEKASRLFAYAGYMWLSFIIIFAPAAMIVDVYNVIVLNGDYLFGKEFHPAAVSRYGTIVIPFVIALALNAYGYFEAKRLRVETLTVKTPRLPAGTDKIRIAQISDLHLGIIVRDEMLDRVIHELELQRPDIIVSTGDLLDGPVRHIGRLAKKLEKVRAPMGKFAVMGNHEFYGGRKDTAGFIEEAGFTVLSGRGVTIEGKINIAGVDYFPEEKKGGGRDEDPEQEMLSALPAGIFTLLLKHKSAVNKNSRGLFDLQLSGHTHDGQIFPVSLIMPFVFRYRSGYTKLPWGAALYLSRGTGTGGPPIRFLSPPELTIIEVVPSGQ
ncbi:MAG: metallophosphoesterase [Nitrospirae bacterium]|nr:metallophosphoesterase [Nitrospirota bacterium]